VIVGILDLLGARNARAMKCCLAEFLTRGGGFQRADVSGVGHSSQAKCPRYLFKRAGRAGNSGSCIPENPVRATKPMGEKRDCVCKK